MKKMSIWALLLAMSISMLTGCSNEETKEPATESTPSSVVESVEEESGLDDAVAYVKTIYKKEDGKTTAKDYQRVGSVPVGAKTFEITWTVDVAEDIVSVVRGEDGMVTIDVNEENPEEVAYVLTASLTDGTDTETLTWNHVLPAGKKLDSLTYAEIVALAYAVADGDVTEDTYRLFGTVTSIDTAWSDEYKNITVTIAVAGCEEQPIMCYRLSGEGAQDLKVGDAITVEGQFTNYKGTIEFNKGCVLVGYGEFVDQSALLEAAFALGEGDSMDEVSILTGVISEIPTAWSDEYQNITVNLDFDGKTLQCYRLSGEGAKDLVVGQTITVVGTIKNYKGLIEFDKGCKLVPNDAYHSVKNAIGAYKLQDGEAQEVAKTITGTISTIDTAWSDEYQNITVTIVVAGLEDYPIMCYRLSGEGAKDLAVGDVITVTGIIKNYKGTIEFDKGCTLN
ncbi:MAG: hypothetical protein IJW63_01980 [Lachnospiraceae bacterium]|nr:hypothetical protein [Lachnospiraceae bacterium]